MMYKAERESFSFTLASRIQLSKATVKSRFYYSGPFWRILAVDRTANIEPVYFVIAVEESISLHYAVEGLTLKTQRHILITSI